MDAEPVNDDEANHEISLTVRIPNHAFRRLEKLAARTGQRVELVASAELYQAIDRDRGWYGATDVEWETGSWISRNLFPPPDYAFAAGAFAGRELLYETAVDDPVLLGIVDGVGRPAPWKYAHLLESVRRATGSPEAHAFYVALHDNMVAETRWTKRYDWDGWWHPLYALELEPGAEQGGASYVGILSGRRDWLLMHEYSPCNHLRITFHGSADVCSRLRALLDAHADRTAP
jgi:hypothetical protein